MISKEAKLLLEKYPVAIATCVLDKPNVSVAAYVKVLNKEIIITDNYMVQTVKNIKLNNKVDLVVWNSDWVGYKISGTAEYYNDGKWLEYIRKMPENQGLPAKGAIVIKISSIKKIGD